MPAQIVAYESRAQREERLYRECEAAYEVHFAERSRSTHEALVEALQRWRAAQDDLRARRQSEVATSPRYSRIEHRTANANPGPVTLPELSPSVAVVSGLRMSPSARQSAC